MIEKVNENDFRLISWCWDDGEFEIEFRDGNTLELLTDNDESTDWLVKEFERLVHEEIYVAVTDDGEEMKWSGKENPFRPYSELPEWITKEI